MIDHRVKPFVDQLIRFPADKVSRLGINANTITAIGALLGFIAFILASFGLTQAALAFILANRFCDGLDGAVARKTNPSDLGGFLDIVSDFIFYASIPLAFAIADPENACAAAFVIFSFIGTASSFLAYAIIAAKRNITSNAQGQKSFYYLAGVTEGTETVAFLILICLFPAWFSLLAFAFGALCLITTAGRIMMAAYRFHSL